MSRSFTNIRNSIKLISNPYATINVRYVWQHLSGNIHNAKKFGVDFNSIPIINIKPLIHHFQTGANNDNDTQLKHTISELREACRNVGFFYIRNYDNMLSNQQLDNTWKTVKDFFNLPLEKKMEISCVNTPNRGYFRLYEENLGNKNIGDFKEGVDIGVELEENAEKNEFRKPNPWPTNMPQYKTTMVRYFNTMSNLGQILVRGLAMSLNIDKYYFDPIMRDCAASLRITHYPPQPKETVSDEHVGAGAHTDYGMLTILAQTSSGLQVMNRNHEWIEAPVIPDTLIVNLADMLPRLTNNYFVSTPHRVINNCNIHRYSMPFFYEPRLDALIECIPQYRNKDGSTNYPPVIFQKHLQHMYEHTYRRTTPPKQDPILQQSQSVKLS